MDTLRWAVIWEMEASDAGIPEKARPLGINVFAFDGRFRKMTSYHSLIVRLGQRVANEGPRLPAALVPFFEQQKPQGSPRIGQFGDS